jgi:hypothetical protein
MHWAHFNWAVVLRLVGYLGWCVCTYFASLLAWTLLSKKRPSHARRWMRWIAHLKRFREKGTLRLSEMWAAGIFAAMCLVIMGFGYQNVKYPVSEEHNVAVLARIGPNEWKMHDDEQGDFRYRGCDDYPNEANIKPGWMAPRARWKEMGECRSIRGTGLAFWWEYPDKSFRKVIYDNDGKWTAQRWASAR